MSSVSSVVVRRPTTRPALGMTMVLCSGCLFALNGIVSKLLIRGGLDAPRLTAFRAASAFAGVLIIATMVRPGPRRLAVNRAGLPLLIGLGLTGSFLVPMLYFVVQRTVEKLARPAPTATPEKASERSIP